ncbi:ATP-binding protein [Paenibacillus sp. 1P07SE]|uniref:hybrid sensor histidine kinase/response regulator n=1 Tax=Paenibacillus sp. 1P07SE TaxID=3132209 RepID=UPI0039A769D9
MNTDHGKTIVKYGVVFLLFLGLLAGVRLAWTQAFQTMGGSPATGGIVDLRGLGLEDSDPVFLDGEWLFYPGELRGRTGERPGADNASAIQVPGNWQAALDGSSDAYGYGTYRLLIRTDPLRHPVTLWLHGIQAASEVEINGELAGSSGQPADIRENYVPQKGSYLATYYEQGETELEVLIRVANFHKPDQGGLLSPIRFGAQSSIERMRDLSIQFQVAIFCILLLHGLYACILFLIHQERTLFYVALLVLTVGLLIVSGYDQVLLSWMPISYTWTTKLRLILFIWQNALILLIFRRLLYGPGNSYWSAGLVTALLGLSVWLAAAPASVVHNSVYTRPLLVVGFVPILLLIPVLVRLMGRLRNNRDLAYLLLTAAGILANLGWRTLGTGHAYSGIYYPVDVLVTIVGFSTYWFSKYFRQAKENARLNEQLRQEDALKDQFLANTSHELRTPLHGIMTMTDTVVRKHGAMIDSEGKEDLERVVQISRRMSHMLDNLLDVARLKEQRIRLSRKPVLIQSIVPGVVGMLRYLLEGKPIVLRTAMGDSLPPVNADEERLVQVLYNLVHNAIKYTDRGAITISAELREGRLFIQVADTGIGMDEKTRSRAFLAYEQGQAGVQDGRGLGLGLSICEQLVNLHGGALTVQSAPAEGTVFAFDLPLAEDTGEAVVAAAEAAVTAAAETAGAERISVSHQVVEADSGQAEGEGGPESAGQIKILAVDDDPVNLSVLSRMLGDGDYLVQGVTSGEEALALLEAGGWDILIADVMMPGMSGYELTQRVRERHTALDLPILLLTARSQSADIYTGFRAGANDYVTKPVDPLELQYRVRALAAIKQSIEEKLRLEAAYLQAQIQPHFLFNTLNGIASLIEIDSGRMSRMLDAFASYLRISFDYLNTGELAPLSRELELVQAYLYIEKERFGERLTIVWEMDEDRELLLPPLSIQPLVENAVQHGLLRKSGGGTLTIRILRETDRTRIEVEDDGQGMDADTASQLVSRSGKGRRGIGVANTHRRLLRLYGRGLMIRSTPGKGTMVAFDITGSAGQDLTDRDEPGD